MADTVTLRELMDERDLRYGERFASQEQALQVALEAQKRHDEWHNNVVEMVRNQGTNFITKDIYEISRSEHQREYSALGERIRVVEQQYWKILGAIAVLALLYKYLIK